MYYVYILKSKIREEIYIGSTNNLKRRLKEHNSGMETSTKRYAPWELYYYEAYLSENLARLREKKLKHNGNAIRELKKRIGLLKIKEGLPSTTFTVSSQYTSDHFNNNTANSSKDLKRESGAGFTMIELIIAISILSIGIVTVYSIFASILALSNSVSQRLIATYLAKEGMEVARNIRDDNFVNNRKWDKDIKICDKGCQADYKTGTANEASLNKLKKYNDNNFLNLNPDGLYSYDSGTTTRFKRKITVTSEDKDTLKVVVEVFWDYNSKSYIFQTEGYLYNWY